MVIAESSEILTNGLNVAFQKLHMDKHDIAYAKAKFWKDILWKIKLRFSYFLQELILEITCLFIYYGEKITVITLK